MDKLFTYAGQDQHGPHIFNIDERDRSIDLIKEARPLPGQIESYIHSAQHIPGKTQLLIDALGASEWWGSNSNGDAFPEVALTHRGPQYGYETFMHYAYPYKSHVNRGPQYAYGDKVTLSSYDPTMHRVLLVVRVDDRKCYDILNDLANGVYWSVSMGARVPFDICSICQNKARTRREYCTHLRYQMNRILEDGRRVCAINTMPKFFDISFVAVGAEKASYVLQKIASPYELSRIPIIGSAEAAETYYGPDEEDKPMSKVASEARKQAAHAKAADIDKEVPAHPPAVIRSVMEEKANRLMDTCGTLKAREPAIPTPALNQLGQQELPKVLSTLAGLGIDLRPSEFQRIVLVKHGHRALADRLEKQGWSFRPTHDQPKKIPAYARGLSPSLASEKVAMMLRPYLASRSCHSEPLEWRVEHLAKLGGGVHSQWYPMTTEEERKASAKSGLVPLAIALNAGFFAFRDALGESMKKGPAFTRALHRHPWLVPVLSTIGVTALQGGLEQTRDRPLGKEASFGEVDALDRGHYDGLKAASLCKRAGFPLVYVHSAAGRERWDQTEKLAAVREFDRMEPGVFPRVLGASLSGGGMGKAASFGVGMLMSIMGKQHKHMPQNLLAGAVDTAGLMGAGYALSKYLERRQGQQHGNTGRAPQHVRPARRAGSGKDGLG